MELEDLKIKLHQETSTNLELVAKIKAEEEECVEYETLTASYNELRQVYSNVYQAYSDSQQMYDADVKAEREKNDTLQQRLEAQIMCNSTTVSGHKKLIQRVEHETKVAAEREKTFRMELKHLEIKLHQMTSKNLELAAKNNASQALLHIKLVQIMAELKDMRGEQRKKSPAILQDPELVVPVLQDSELQEEADVSEEKASGEE